MAIWSKLVGEASRYLSVAVTIKNSGDVLVAIDCIQLLVYKITPASCEFVETLKIQSNEEARTHFEWPTISKRETYWIGHETIEIEPGEEHVVTYDLIVPGDVVVAQVYAFVRNARKKRRGLGWTSQVNVEFVTLPKMDNIDDGTDRSG